MKKSIAMLLAVCTTAGMLASCGKAEPTEPMTTAVQTTVTEPSTTEETTAGEMTSEPVPDYAEDWRKKAIALLQTVSVPSYLSGISVKLMDMSGDGIPEIIESVTEWEVGGISAIWTWYEGDYVQAYRLIPYSEWAEYRITDVEDQYRPRYFQAFRNTQTGKIEFWDLGEMDYTLEDYFANNESGESKLWPAVGEVSGNLTRIDFADGKLVVEEHDELKRFLQYGMSEDDARKAWEALRDFRNDFWKTHDRKPVDVYFTEVEFKYYEDFIFSDDSNSETAEIDRSRMRTVVEQY